MRRGAAHGLQLVDRCGGIKIKARLLYSDGDPEISPLSPMRSRNCAWPPPIGVEQLRLIRGSKKKGMPWQRSTFFANFNLLKFGRQGAQVEQVDGSFDFSGFG